MAQHKLILDGDYGIGDSIAALYLCRRSDVEILAVGSVHGNATAAAAARNAISVLDLGGRPDVPVAVGAGRPMAQAVSISSMVHGDDGLGGVAPSPPPDREPVPTPAAVQLIETVRSHPGECTVVATGPLTNLALAILLDPDVPSLVAKVVIMGGTVDHPGNVGPYAEANIAHDPEAAQLVLGADWPVTQVGLDVTMPTWLGPAELARVEASTTPTGRFVWGILQHYLAFYAARHGRHGCPVHDPSAALVALDPSLAQWFEAPVDVELRSLRNRGMLVIDRRELAASERTEERPPVKIVIALDSRRLIDILLDGLLGD